MSGVVPSAPADIDDADHIQPGRNHSSTSNIIPALSAQPFLHYQQNLHVQVQPITGRNHSRTSKIIPALPTNFSCAIYLLEHWEMCKIKFYSRFGISTFGLVWIHYIFKLFLHYQNTFLHYQKTFPALPAKKIAA